MYISMKRYQVQRLWAFILYSITKPIYLLLTINSFILVRLSKQNYKKKNKPKTDKHFIYKTLISSSM